MAATHPQTSEPSGYNYALIGNMNVGKTLVFSSITTKKIKSVNLPGSTVTISSAPLRSEKGILYDTPGNVSIFSENEDERASREVLLSETFGGEINGIILMADAKNLARSLALALQYGEFGLPMLVNINMMDEAVSRGIEIDTAKLAKLLGVEVTTTIAPEGMGLRELVGSFDELRPLSFHVSYTPAIETLLADIAREVEGGRISPRGVGLLLLNHDRDVRRYVRDHFGRDTLDRLVGLIDAFYRENPTHSRNILTEHYITVARRIADEVQTTEPVSRNSKLATFGDMCTSFSTGIPIAVLVLAAMYYFIGAFGATYLVDSINSKIFEGILLPAVSHFTDRLSSQFLRDMLMDPDFGILPTGVFLAMGLVLPVIFCFYITFGILEDSGYLPRISILLDKVFHKLGLNGKGVIPLVMGFSCVTMALLTTRVLNTEKEKIIASFLLYLCLPCAPLIAVMLIILEKMPVSASVAVFGILASQVLVAGYLANRFLPGNRSPLFLEIPPMRLPKPWAVLKMALAKTWFFMLEALPVFILASAGVFLFERAGGLHLLEHTLGPMIHHVMGLPEKSVQVFIKTMIRRESGATELEHLRQIYTNLQLVVNLLVMTFVAPCINSFIVLFKERGLKVGLAINIAVFVYAILMGSIVNHLCLSFGVTFS
ncbi:ferrous iron transporter B [Desulfopila aestuarii]|uniref:Ferrous iron transport protein B n=1 Tax=Desulfopila aestuarii DSM 18488 TaxID=1121416 RepID=A0A1M7Y536_9BACT|nr:ferrous iron transporter B [Desulfopila aestuarii]SHO47514.1 ferrous iron transport protein B [Desulfopila aestuarii DSM 18488]